MSDFTMGATLTLTDNFSSTLTAAGHNAEAFKSQITGISSAMSSSTASMGENAAAFDILFYSFTMDVPRAEICCEIGRLFMEKREYVTAAYWYQQALLAPRKKKNGGFYIADSHDFIPAIQMCVCLDKAGRHREAFEFHKKARVLKPLHQAVIGNEKYFRDVWGME